MFQKHIRGLTSNYVKDTRTINSFIFFHVFVDYRKRILEKRNAPDTPHFARIYLCFKKCFFVCFHYGFQSTGNLREWLLAIIIISAASVGIFFMFFVHFCVKKKWKSSYNISNCKSRALAHPEWVSIPYKSNGDPGRTLQRDTKCDLVVPILPGLLGPKTGVIWPRHATDDSFKSPKSFRLGDRNGMWLRFLM